MTKIVDKLDRLISIALANEEKAQRRVSHLEEKMAKHTRPASIEGGIARRGAVRAAMACGDVDRAKELVKRFLAEDGATAELSAGLETLLRG
jgi:hypothetical protein